jgi:hypothetical protein
VKQLHAAPYVQILTMPALDILADDRSANDDKADRKRGFSFFSRRPVTLGLQYDPSMVAAQIVHGLECAHTLRAEHQARLEHQKALPAAEPQQLALTIRAAANAAAAEIAASTQSSQSTALLRMTEDRRGARRSARGDVPWLSAVRLSWGVDVSLINISSRGLLVECGAKLTPGITTELHLSGPGTNLLVKVRFVRSEVAKVDGNGVRYHAAAEFEKELDLGGRRRETAALSSSSQALVDLLASVMAESNQQPEPAQVRFARGLRKLVGARDVMVRKSPIAPADGSESIYFDVNTGNRSRAVLQVMFDRDRALTQSEFKLLKAAASIVAAVVELEKPLSDRSVAQPDAQMSEVA